jgi:hypothetical protein
MPATILLNTNQKRQVTLFLDSTALAWVDILTSAVSQQAMSVSRAIPGAYSGSPDTHVRILTYDTPIQHLPQRPETTNQPFKVLLRLLSP